MIRTEVFINSVFMKPHSISWMFGLTEAFRCYIPREIRGRVTWYWNVSEVLHNLSANIIGGFTRLNDIISLEVQRLLSDLICWILAAYGIDLFPVAQQGSKKDLSTKLTSYRPFQEIRGRVSTLNWIHNDHGYAYHLYSKHRPSHLYYSSQYYASNSTRVSQMPRTPSGL